ncbi:MAG: hypothetical protein QM569_05430 [Acidovorax sp.]|uniref:hypothetical protein n=1 Tax=Acidovorax sp. TaxID=1872122 RepID=UPI0039E36BD6
MPCCWRRCWPAPWAWLALAMEAHWTQVRPRTRLEPGLELFHESDAGLRTTAALNIDFGETEADERSVTRDGEAGVEPGALAHTRSRMAAMPCPTPMHMLHSA